MKRVGFEAGVKDRGSYGWSYGRARVTTNGLTHFVHSSKMGTVTKGFDARLANRPFLVFDFRALWRSTCISVRVAESQKVKMVG